MRESDEAAIRSGFLYMDVLISRQNRRERFWITP